VTLGVPVGAFHVIAAGKSFSTGLDLVPYVDGVFTWGDNPPSAAQAWLTISVASPIWSSVEPSGYATLRTPFQNSQECQLLKKRRFLMCLSGNEAVWERKDEEADYCCVFRGFNAGRCPRC